MSRDLPGDSEGEGRCPAPRCCGGMPTASTMPTARALESASGCVRRGQLFPKKHDGRSRCITDCVSAAKGAAGHVSCGCHERRQLRGALLGKPKLNVHGTTVSGRPAPAASFDSCKRLLCCRPIGSGGSPTWKPERGAPARRTELRFQARWRRGSLRSFHPSGSPSTSLLRAVVRWERAAPRCGRMPGCSPLRPCRGRGHGTQPHTVFNRSAVSEEPRWQTPLHNDIAFQLRRASPASFAELRTNGGDSDARSEEPMLNLHGAAVRGRPIPAASFGSCKRLLCWRPLLSRGLPTRKPVRGARARRS